MVQTVASARTSRTPLLFQSMVLTTVAFKVALAWLPRASSSTE
jgi:hypothetical protein